MNEYLERIEVHRIDETADELVLRINNIDASLANAIRRTVISDTPTMAIEWVYLRENSSVMADEVLAHRLGLVPVLADPERFVAVTKPEGFVPENDTVPENSIYFELAVDNPTEETVSVYSDQIRVSSGHQEVAVKPGILITRLAPRQRIECRMIAIKGVGREHAKWMPASICSYRFVKGAEINDPSQLPEIKKYFRAGLAHDGAQVSVDENRLVVNTDVVKDYPGAVTITPKENQFIFELEAIAEPPRSILQRALRTLQAKLADIHRDTQTARQHLDLE